MFIFYCQDEWKASLVFIVPGGPNAEIYVQALVDSAVNGNRRRFYAIDKEQLKQMVHVLYHLTLNICLQLAMCTTVLYRTSLQVLHNNNYYAELVNIMLGRHGQIVLFIILC